MRWILVFLVAAAFASCSSGGGGFSDSDIQAIKESIRSHYDGKGTWTFEEVQMIRTSPTSLQGFVRLKPWRSDASTTIPCMAATDVQTGKHIWRCGLGV